MYSRPTKIQRKLCVESVDLTLVTDEPVALLARMKKVGKIVLNKWKGNITLPNVIVHVDNKLTKMRNFRNVQTRHPGFFETVDFVYKLEFESVVCLKPNTWLSDLAIFLWLKKTMEIYATEVVISELNQIFLLVVFCQSMIFDPRAFMSWTHSVPKCCSIRQMATICPPMNCSSSPPARRPCIALSTSTTDTGSCWFCAA